MRSNFKAQLSRETQQMKLLRLERAKINFRTRLSHETQEEKLIRQEKMKTDYKAQRLHESSELKLFRLEKARSVRQTNRLDGSTADSIKRFRDSIKVGPYFVCVGCNRMLYRVSVTKCRTEKYPTVVQLIFTDVKSYDNTEYICHTCHVKAMKGNVPCQAVSNKMEVHAVPMQLKYLRKLESVLVSQKIMFEKIVVMPKGKQRKIYGTVCNILVNCDSMPESAKASRVIRYYHVEVERKAEVSWSPVL